MKDARIVEAFDRVRPDPEARSRMLEAIREKSGALPAASRNARLRRAAACCAALAMTATLILLIRPRLANRAPLILAEDSTAEPAVSSTAAQAVPPPENALPVETASPPPPLPEFAAEDSAEDSAEASRVVSGALPETARSPSLILRGTVISRSEPFREDSGDADSETSSESIGYSVRPTEVFRGKLDGAEEISVRLGKPGDLLADAAAPSGPAPIPFDALETGAEYLFFLSGPARDTESGARGYYYLSNAVFPDTADPRIPPEA